MNPHLHPPKINSVAMDQLPTPRTDRFRIDYGIYDDEWNAFAKSLERELLASQARERVLRSALEQVISLIERSEMEQVPDDFSDTLLASKQALNHP